MLDAIIARPENHDVVAVMATVETSNDACERSFRRFTSRHGACMERIGGYPAHFFPESYKAERLFRISGLRAERDG
jgi:hypothetical protein